MAAEKSKEDRVRVLELELEEQRHDYGATLRFYEQARVKNISFLAAALALLTYLYGTVPDGHASLRQRLFIPIQPYGVIVYFIGLALFITAVVLLVYALRSRTWHTAYDNDQEECVTESYERYLQYMHKRYLTISRLNGATYAKKQGLLEMSLLPLLVGGIVLLVLKIFGGQ